MEKLTEKLKYVLEDCIDCISPIQQEVINKAVDRLAAYEDTGLEPEELAQAEKDGRRPLCRRLWRTSP